MKGSTCQITEKIFLTICIILTIACTIACIYQYALNEDSSTISFERYHETEDNIYPAITICFADYLKSDLFENSSDEYRYKDFLAGKLWDDKFDRMNYEESLKDIMDYFLKATRYAYNLEENEYFYHEYRTHNAENNWKPKFYPTIMMNKWSTYTKCWTFELEYARKLSVEQFTLSFKTNIFKDSLRKTYENLAVFFTYPGQIGAQTAHKSMWKPTNYTRFTMEFNIQNVVVLKQRRTFRKSCNPDWKRNDEKILTRTVERVGCRPIFFPLNVSMPVCKNSSQALEQLNDIVKKIRPCKRIEKVLYSFNEYYNNINGADHGVGEETDVFLFSFMFQGSTFTEIEQIRAYNFQSLIGNAGGYVGLFLGAAISQIPSAILRIKRYFKK